jgi:hypothetical protein
VCRPGSFVSQPRHEIAAGWQVDPGREDIFSWIAAVAETPACEVNGEPPVMQLIQSGYVSPFFTAETLSAMISLMRTGSPNCST